MTQTSKDKQASFLEKMTGILNGGALNLALAIGYRTGLFDLMDTFDTPQSLDAISQESGLSQRYIKEWLGIMITGGIVEITQGQDGTHTYFLPPEHSACLTRRAGNANLAVYSQEIPLLTTCALEPVLAGFTSGDGVSYSNYPRFQAFMTELSNAKHRQVLVDKFLPSVDEGKVLHALEKGIRVCDLGCGEGVATLLMAHAFPASRFVGIDNSRQAIAVACDAASQAHLKNIDFYVQDAALLRDDSGLKGRYDYITAFDAIHDQTAPLQALRSVKHMLAAGGAFSMIDIAAETNQIDNQNHPMGPFLYTVSLMHCMPVGLVDGGAGLGMMWGRQKAVELLKEAGFEAVEVCQIPDDPFNLHFFCRA